MTLVRATWGAMALLVLLAVGFLFIWSIPAPTARVEQIIPDEKLPQ